MVVKLWCDEEQSEKVRQLPSCDTCIKSQKDPSYYIVTGDPTLQDDIDVVLGRNEQ